MITAVAKPNNISWACQSSGDSGIGSAMAPSTAATQKGTEIAAKAAAPR